jgi:hypothetical protein
MGKRFETYAALLAVILASLSAVDIAGRPRPVFAVAAIVLLVVIGLVRLRSGLQSRKVRPQFDAYERALRIQEARDKKYWR